MKNFPSDSDLKKIVRELCEGKELAKQLQNHLNLQSSSSSSSHESREFLLHRIMHSYDQALSILTRNELAAAGGGGGGGGEETPRLPLPTSESPWSIIGSPQSDDSDQDFTTDQASRKKKGSVRWSEKVKVRAEGVEGQLDDGYGWRKYGQKDILGAKYPRGYYRCTYRHAHGCLATKQVQRSDEDPTIYEITYRRKHTCDRVNAINSANNPPVPMSDPQSEDPNPLTHNPPQNEPPFNIQTSLTNTKPFNFSSSPAMNPQSNNIFSDHNDDLGNYYPNPINDLSDNFGQLIPNLRHSDSELSPIVAAMTTTAASNSPTLDTGYPFGPSKFGSGFNFGNFGHYP